MGITGIKDSELEAKPSYIQDKNKMAAEMEIGSESHSESTVVLASVVG